MAISKLVVSPDIVTYNQFMRNLVMVIGTIIVLVILLAIVSNIGLAESEGLLTQGIVDFTKNSALQNRLIVLNGQWGFFPNIFIDAHALPETNTRLLHVPGDWENVSTSGERDGYGIGSYVLRLDGLAEGSYGIFLDTIYTASTTYIHGQKVSETGIAAVDKDSFIPEFADSLVLFTVAENDQVNIVIHVSNFYHPLGGIGVAPLFGPQTQVVRYFVLQLCFVVALVCFFITAAIVSLLFHGKVNRDNSLIYFSLFCFLIALKIAASNSLLAWFFPDFPVMLISKIEYITMPLAACVFNLFTKRIYGRNIPRWIEPIFWVISCGYATLILIFPITWYFIFIVPFIVFLIIYFSIWTVLAVKQMSDSYRYLLLFGAAILIISMALQLYYYVYGSSNIFLNQVMGVGMAFFVIVNLHLLTQRFLQAIEEVRDLSTTLEKRVNNRTEELHALNEQLAWSAAHDGLTGMLNRNELMKSIIAGAPDGPFSVAYLDLDNFKLINDFYSHEAGDKVLELFAKQLFQTCRSTDTVYRVGGDEFVVLMPFTDTQGASAFAERILTSMNTLCKEVGNKVALELELADFDPEKCELTTSIGLAVSPNGTKDIEVLIQLADSALLQAKREGKCCYRILTI